MTKILDQQSRFQKSLSLWESRRLSGGEGVHACHAKLLIHKTADSQNNTPKNSSLQILPVPEHVSPASDRKHNEAF
jgi:hypothetical protein